MERGASEMKWIVCSVYIFNAKCKVLRFTFIMFQLEGKLEKINTNKQRKEGLLSITGFLKAVCEDYLC